MLAEAVAVVVVTALDESHRLVLPPLTCRNVGPPSWWPFLLIDRLNERITNSVIDLGTRRVSDNVKIPLSLVNFLISTVQKFLFEPFTSLASIRCIRWKLKYVNTKTRLKTLVPPLCLSDSYESLVFSSGSRTAIIL